MCQTLALIHSGEVLSELGFISLATSTARPENLDSAWVEEQGKLLRSFFTLLVELASARCWSQVHHAMCLPNILSRVHDEQVEMRDRGLNSARQVWRAVLRAEEIVYNEPDSLPAATLASLRKCLYEMAWNRQQLSREAYAVCENGQWKATDGDVRALSFALFARPMNTKMYLEDMFGHVSSTIKRLSKNDKAQKQRGFQTCPRLCLGNTPKNIPTFPFNGGLRVFVKGGPVVLLPEVWLRWTKYFYMRATPSFKQAKFPVVETTFQDFLAATAGETGCWQSETA